MKTQEELVKVGEYNSKFNEILELNIDIKNIYMSKGLESHMIKRKHYKSLKYIKNIPDIINDPDYLGVNPNEQGISIELIKKYEDNVMVGIKLDSDREYLYVSTMHDIQESKITRRLHSGRIKEFSIDNVQKT